MFGTRIVLIVDDDDDDVEIMSESIIKLSENSIIRRAINGHDALRFLQEVYPEKPSQIILDINMPLMDGVTFLEHIRSDVRFKDISVCVFTTSNRDLDKTKVTALGARYYLKPSSYSQWESYFSEIIKSEARRQVSN